MKKLCFLLSLFCIFSIASDVQGNDFDDSNAVFLNLEDSQNIINQKYENIKKGSVDYTNLSIKNAPVERNYDKLLYQDVNRQIPQKKSYSKSLEKDLNKNTLFGATYKTTASSAEWSDSLSVYSKYKKERFSFTSSYTPNKLDLKSNKNSGTVSFAPELKLNNHVSIKNVYSDNLENRQKKNEVVLSLKPFKDERMDLNLGAGQTYSTDNLPAKSQLNFSTKFRF